MILSTENGALRERVGERKAIEILAKAGFDAIDYTFTPWMERGEMPWNGNDYVSYAKEVNQIAKDNGIHFNQAHASFIFHTSYLPDWNREIMPLQIRCMEACALLGIPHMVVHPVHHLVDGLGQRAQVLLGRGQVDAAVQMGGVDLIQLVSQALQLPFGHVSHGVEAGRSGG